MPVFDSFVGAVAVFFTQPAQAIYTVLPNNGALLIFQVLGVLVITRPRAPRITPHRFWPLQSLYGQAMRIGIELHWFVLPRG